MYNVISEFNLYQWLLLMLQWHFGLPGFVIAANRCFIGGNERVRETIVGTVIGYVLLVLVSKVIVVNAHELICLHILRVY